jgi:hypothetical protein
MPRAKCDFSVAWASGDLEPFFRMLEEEAEARGLSFLLVSDRNVSRVLRRIQSGNLAVRFHLDASADYSDERDPYARLAFAVRDAGGYVVDDPDAAAAAAHKAIIHHGLEKAGVPVPYTVVVRNWEPSRFHLSPEERSHLGVPFIMKPARGFGRLGVARVERGTLREMARARGYDRGDDFLLQRLVQPVRLGGRPAWLRLVCVFGEVMPNWWDTETNHYTPVTVEEFARFRLGACAEIMWRTAEVTGMDYFSTEIAVERRGRRLAPVVIDYANDQCDMTLQTLSHCGPPDAVVERTAWGMVEAASRIVRGGAPTGARRVHFVGGR